MGAVKRMLLDSYTLGLGIGFALVNATCVIAELRELVILVKP